MVKLERRGRTAVMLLDRPEVGNALNDEMIARIFRLLDEVRADSNLRALVVTGSGKIFSAGAEATAAAIAGVISPIMELGIITARAPTIMSSFKTV